MAEFTDAELAAFLDEALPASRSSELEHALRGDGDLRRRLQQVSGRETAGLHSIAAIWRRGRLSCPPRAEMGRYVLGTLEAGAADYLRFHVDVVGCRYCAANLEDLQAAAEQPPDPRRRKRYFETSVGRLRESSG